MNNKTLNIHFTVLSLGEGWGEGAQLTRNFEQTIAGFSLSLWERVGVWVRRCLRIMAEILEA